MLFENINKGVEECRATEGAQLIDVREADEFASGHIPGAVNIPLSRIQDCSFPAETPLFTYCLMGSRSARAAGALKKLGYQSVKNIGGINRYKGELEK